jgi:hypothetical protein
VPKPEDSGQLVSMTANAAEKVRELLSRGRSVAKCPSSHRSLRLLLGLSVRARFRSGTQRRSRDRERRPHDPGRSAERSFCSREHDRFVLDLRHSGFKVENPNASSTCRCGESFELAEEQTG